MTKSDVDFDTWFELLCDNLADKGIHFNNEDSVRADYEEGKSMFDVMDEIAAEYGVE